MFHNYQAKDKLNLCSFTQRMIIGEREGGYEEWESERERGERGRGCERDKQTEKWRANENNNNYTNDTLFVMLIMIIFSNNINNFFFHFLVGLFLNCFFIWTQCLIWNYQSWSNSIFCLLNLHILSHFHWIFTIAESGLIELA